MSPGSDAESENNNKGNNSEEGGESGWAESGGMFQEKIMSDSSQKSVVMEFCPCDFFVAIFPGKLY